MLSKTDQINTLIELNEELENYFQNTIIPQLFFDAQLILRKFTPAAMRQFKLKDDDIGRHLSDIEDNFRFPTITENIEQVISSGQILEKEIQTTDFHWFQMNILPYLIRKENKANGVIITFIDITTRIKDLKEQEKLIAEHELLLDSIAHDIKNPLAALGMSIALLKKVPEKGMDRFPTLVQHIESCIHNMNGIIADLMQNHWDQNRYEAVDEMLDLENILEDVRLTLATQIEESKAVIKTNLGPSEITFSRRKLRSVIFNLVDNALKYKSANRLPEILITSYKENRFMVISVADNGIGIGPQNLRSVFVKYRRILTAIDGNGVGLHLVKEILETAGGKITVESELEKGSVFRVYLPLSKR
jgi:two-component system phosphate regulon sensor histidine kinase PhoR